MTVRRRWIALVAIISMLLAACGSPSAGGTAGNTASPAASPQAAASPAASPQAAASPAASPQSEQLAGGQPITMHMAWWGSQNRHDRTIKVIELFRQQHPNVNITYEFAAFDDYFTKMTTQAAGGNLPCLMQQDYQKISDWVTRGLLLPLDDYVANGTIDTSNIDDAYLAGGRLNGKLYAISLGTNTQALLLDTQSFEKAGVALPPDDWTWQDFEQVITQIHDKLGIYGMGTGLSDNQVFKLWLKQHGKALYNAEGTALGYDDDQLFVDFFTMLKRFSDSGAMPTREFEVSQQGVSVEDSIFVRQQAAIGYQWSNQLVAVSNAAKRPIELHLFPRPENGHHGHYLKPSMFFSITSKCPHPDVAAAFIDFFTNSVEANQILAAERGVPISLVVREAIQDQLNAAQKEAFEIVAKVGEDPSPLDPPDPPGSVEVIDNVYVPLMDQVLYGQIAPEGAAKQFRDQANAILARNKQ
ncbi:ABC transporter substrate-binding protein [Kallotenue papyrolyticum]|uniref:ABC transporter substrate-binding protein n=1 Tax=Kallotenue papyrolyticum TaxID=1325125 RepID=UPI0004785F9C|nr:extracellular solute-binding protein [Kallotenue papyrolyticum]